MTAASFWSLLNPAFKIAHEHNYINSQLNFLLIVIGFLLGGLFVHVADVLLPSITSKQMFHVISHKKTDDDIKTKSPQQTISNLKINPAVHSRLKRNQDLKGRLHVPIGDSPMEEVKDMHLNNNDERTKWHRLLLLIIAVTLHNFPG